MLEETHITGEQPDAELVYKLRKAALKEVHLPALLDLIGDDQKGNGFRIVTYLKLSFGISTPLLKKFLTKLPHEESVNSDHLPSPIVYEIEKAIEQNKNIWSERLQPSRGGDD